MMTDIEIARNTKLKNIQEIANEINIDTEDLEQYGKYKAKISDKIYKKIDNNKNGKLVLVTAMSPTPLGEGKTTVSIAIADGLRKINQKSILALREPSLASIWNKGRSNWWWKSSSSSNGRYKFAFYRRYSCNYFCK